jgi:two-component system response regulator PilR (NtrC family)/two-component system response regulator HydG
MAGHRGQILIVEDDREMLALLKDVCGDSGFTISTEESSQQALRRVEAEHFDVVISDIEMAGVKGFDLLEKTKECSPLTPVILITAFGSIESAIKAMKLGAFDYLTKPFEMEELLLVIEKALENRYLKSEVLRLQREVQGRYGFAQIIAQSDAMKRVLDLVSRVCDNPSNVLITGETGTGKEMIARLIHYNGPRGQKAFVPINCAAIPESLLESELFGHQKGAFTDAKVSKKGLFLEADGGTLFLDEVGEMPLPIQAKILRTIEDREIRPLGETRSTKVDVRVVSATKKDLRSLVQEDTFRGDLYFRLNVIGIRLPPLRERREDIIPLTHLFLESCCKRFGKKVRVMSPETMKRLLEYPWPGNVRELQNAVEHAVSLAQKEVISPDDLPTFLGEEDDARGLVAQATQRRYTVSELEQAYVMRVLDETGGNKARAAQILGMDRKTLYRKLHEYQAKAESSRRNI